MNAGVLRFCGWTGPLFMLLFLIAMIFAVLLIPPTPPSATAADIGQFYKDHSACILAAAERFHRVGGREHLGHVACDHVNGGYTGDSKLKGELT